MDNLLEIELLEQIKASLETIKADVNLIDDAIEKVEALLKEHEVIPKDAAIEKRADQLAKIDKKLSYELKEIKAVEATLNDMLR